jgi:hypothetical protein
MFKSTTIRAALTQPVLSILLIALSGQPASAQLPVVFKPAGGAEQPTVIIAQTATVVSSAHYQAKLALSCGGALCFGQFPTPAAKHRLNLMRMTCFLQGTTNSTFDIAEIDLLNANNVVLLPEFPIVGFSSPTGRHTLNQAVDIQVAATQYIGVSLVLASGTASSGGCTATGTLDTLQ